jgi:LysR substrate binding domain
VRKSRRSSNRWSAPCSPFPSDRAQEREADLALHSGPITDKDLVVRKVCESGWSLYASEAYLARKPAPVDPNDLTGHEIIGYDASLSAVPAVKWIELRVAKATAAPHSRIGLAAFPCMLGDSERALRRLTPDVFASATLVLCMRRQLG